MAFFPASVISSGVDGNSSSLFILLFLKFNKRETLREIIYFTNAISEQSVCDKYDLMIYINMSYKKSKTFSVQ